MLPNSKRFFQGILVCRANFGLRVRFSYSRIDGFKCKKPVGKLLTANLQASTKQRISP